MRGGILQAYFLPGSERKTDIRFAPSKQRFPTPFCSASCRQGSTTPLISEARKCRSGRLWQVGWRPAPGRPGRPAAASRAQSDRKLGPSCLVISQERRRLVISPCSTGECAHIWSRGQKGLRTCQTLGRQPFHPPISQEARKKIKTNQK